MPDTRKLTTLERELGRSVVPDMSNLYGQLGNRAVIMGDSLAQINGWDSPYFPDPEGYVSAKSTGVFVWANVFLNQAFDIAANIGIGGQTTRNIKQRWDEPDQYGPNVIMLSVGANDILTGVGAGETCQNLLELYEHWTLKGYTVIDTAVTVNTSITTSVQIEALHTINRFKKDYADRSLNVIFIDYGHALADASTGVPATNYTYDGLHYSQIGAATLGKIMADKLSAYAVANAPFLPHSKPLRYGGKWTDREANSNPTTQGNSSGLATGYFTNIAGGAGPTITPTKVARSDRQSGSWQQIVVSGASAAHSCSCIISVPVFDLVQGATYQPVVEFETDSASWTAAALEAQVLAFNSGAIQIGGNLLIQGIGSFEGYRPAAGTFKGPRWTLPANTDSLQLQMVLRGGNGTFRFSNFSVLRVS